MPVFKYILLAGFKKKDDACDPLMLSANSNNNFSFLETACSILVAWKNSNLVGLTKETFMACIQSLQAMVSLSKYLISCHDFSYVLPGKFCSDPIEARFGWYRQVNGGNFFMSINQLFLAEKKIRCLSLIQKYVMFRAATQDSLEIASEGEQTSESNANHLWLYHFLVEKAAFEDFSETDACVAYYVSGYIARSICRRRKCFACKELLIMKDVDTSIETLLEGNESELLRMANRGGLAIPTNYCFAVCTFAMQLYSVVFAEEEIKKNYYPYLIKGLVL